MRELEDLALKYRGLLPLAANVFFDDGKPVDNAIERSMHRFKRIMGTRDVVLDPLNARRAFCPKGRALLVCTQVFDMDQQIGKPAFDRLQMAETGVRSIQPFDQFDDAIFEMAKREIVTAR